MGDAFSSGHGQQLSAYAAAKENAEDVRGCLPFGECFVHPKESLLVSLDELLDTGMQAAATPPNTRVSIVPSYTC